LLKVALGFARFDGAGLHEEIEDRRRGDGWRVMGSTNGFFEAHEFATWPVMGAT